MNSTNQEQPKQNLEECFIEAYQQKNFDEKLYDQSLNNFINQIKGIGIIPQTDVIQKCKIYSIPDFLGLKFDNDSQSFFNATMATGALLCNILLINDTLLIKTKDGLRLDPEKLKLKQLAVALKEFPAGCEHFRCIINLAFIIRGIELGRPRDKMPPSNKISQAIKFLTNVVLVQRLLVHSRAFKPFVEVIGNIFINSMMIQNKKHEKFEIVANFIDHEKSNFSNNEKYDFNENDKSTTNQSKTNNEYQVYLDFVRTVIILYNDPQLPLMLCDTEIITLATDFGIPPFFHAFVNFLASMIMTPDLAEYVFNYIKKTLSEILSFKNFFDAIFLHPQDFQNETDRQKLSDDDVLGLESVLRLLTAFFRQDLGYFKKMSDAINFDEEYKNEDFVKYLTRSLIKFILSPVPASLKAECFNCLASMQVDLWNTLLTSKVLVYDEASPNDETSRKYEGIISDIMNVERPASYFSIPQALSHLIGSMLKNEQFAPVDFIIYHRFLHKIILTNLQSSDWKFSNQDMKWEMLQNICKAWNNLLNRKDYIEYCDPLYHSAISDPDFIKNLISLTNTELCPVECLIEVYRLFLLLAWKENEFLSKSLSTNEPLTAGIVNKISRDSSSAIKMLRCFMSHFMNLQIVSMELVEFIASASPIIVQVLLTKPTADSIRICDSLIKYDESEDIEDFLIEGSENKSREQILSLLEKDKDGNPIIFNARCFLLQILINLGSSSFLVRHICGFDQHDPPKSIRATNLNKGILIGICEKLCEEDTHINYPIFVAKSIQLLLIECRHDLTINSTLNLLRSSLRQFFTTQLEFLSNPNSSKIAIGCFLQIMALENANSVQYGSELSGIILNSFNFLMLPLQNTQKSTKRNVLFLDFIDRIQQDNESINILNGINDLTVAYLSNPSIIDLMNENKQNWPSTWMHIIFSLLEKVPNLTNRMLSSKVVGTCSLIANAVLIDKKFGTVNPEDSDLKKLFTLILKVTSLLFDFNHYDSRISAYSLLNTVANSLNSDNEQIKTILHEKEQMILDTTLNDCRSEIPILRSISFSVIESLLPFASPWAFLPFLEQAIATTEDDWTLFDANKNAAAFSLSAKCRMYAKFLTTLKSESSLSNSKVSPSCKIIIDEALIVKLSDKSFWNSLVEIIGNSSGNEAQIQTATDILSLFSVISVAFNDSDDLRIQLNWFLKKFPKTIIDIGKELTPCSLRLYESFYKLLSTHPNLGDLDNLDILNRIPFLFRNFANEIDWKKHLKKDTPDIFNQAQNIVSNILMHGIFVLTKISEKTDIFGAPLFGEDWRTKNNQIQNNDQYLPLSIITSYLGRILKEIKESETNKIKDDNKKDTDDKQISDHNDDDKKLNERKRGVASSCLLLIWYHINRWRRSTKYYDMGKIKEQAQAFSKEPYINFTGNSSLDALILKQLAQ